MNRSPDLLQTTLTPTTHAGDAARARAWKFGADIDTDVLAPGAYMKQGIDVIAQHCLEAVRPDFASGVRAGDVVVAGPNFGIGSSREQAAAALVRLGVAAVVAPSYSGLFFRNAFNVGLLLLTCPRAGQLQDGEPVALDLAAPAVIGATGERLACEPIPDFLLEMVRAGGLLPALKLQLAKEANA
jgi:3-isopropylmalate/(R)-2-methylmalate dehydratase small subunit